MRFAFALLAVLATTSLPAIGEAGGTRELRGGANHHLGDDSFVARFGRAPTPGDPEELRMHVHLEYVRDLLARGAPTRPDLAGRRAELLGYLGDYIAAGTTPSNTYVPWRSPVFIDADGRICAVGYLIERSVGRALPERIAAAHRLSYLEDIAAAMPEVAAWVASSGLTLDELASIQPGYNGPEVQYFAGWDPTKIKDGKYHQEADGTSLDGDFKRGQMAGAWKRTSGDGKLLGSGTFRGGAGTWKSLRPDGKKLAEGPYADSRAEGEWRFFHPSGRLAAIGSMRKGKRAGAWTFFYDAKGSPVLSTGQFIDGETAGEWKHFAAGGRLVATASGRAWSPTGLTLSIEPGADGVRHTVTQGEPATTHRLDAFFLGKDTLYIRDRTEMFDQGGSRVEKIDGAWVAHACNWTARRKKMAAAGDVFSLYKALIREEYQFDGGDPKTDCSDATTQVPAARGKHFDAMLASRRTVHAPIPAWSFRAPNPDDAAAFTAGPDETEAADAAAGPELDPANASGDEEDARVIEGWPEPIPGDNPADLTTYLARRMTWYMEWPHVDETFLAVYASMPGYAESRSPF